LEGAAMMGRIKEQGQLFYRFRIEDHVPQTHLLRRVDRFLDFSPLGSELAPLYSNTGRPSVDPELMIRMLLIGYLFGIRSETRLCEDVHLNLAYRWFCRLGLEGPVPDRSTFSKNRHGRFAAGDVMRRVFETVVAVCADAGLIGGTGGLVDGSTVHADANRDKRAGPDKIEDVWRAKDSVTRPVQAYLDDLEGVTENPPTGPQHKPPKYISETDPQAAWSLKDGPGRFSYEVNYVADDKQDHRGCRGNARPSQPGKSSLPGRCSTDRSADLLHPRSLQTRVTAQAHSCPGSSREG
jgi:transposase